MEIVYLLDPLHRLFVPLEVGSRCRKLVHLGQFVQLPWVLKGCSVAHLNKSGVNIAVGKNWCNIDFGSDI